MEKEGIKKSFVIVGGGISGLTLLHYLKLQNPQEDIKLFEKDQVLGGTIRSLIQNGYTFETGPNAFLDSGAQTKQFIAELGLNKKIIKANAAATMRWVFKNNKLHPFPTNPKNFFAGELLSPIEKLRVLGEIFIPKRNDPKESVYSFGARRFGPAFAENFLDPLVSGIYGGDARQLNLKAAFPKIYDLEKKFGSLSKARFKSKKQHVTLSSFEAGMSEIIKALGLHYRDHIFLNQEITKIIPQAKQYMVESNGQSYVADKLFISTPAYAAASLVKDMDLELSESLNEIAYAPLAVIGLGYRKTAFQHAPQGFGYLFPSSEKKKILGVLFESNIFPCRSGADQCLLRVMLGGMRHADILKHSKEALIALAQKEIETRFFPREKPEEIFFKSFEKAIPQYDQNYVRVKEILEKKLIQWQNLYLAANYYHGVSFNDCIEQAYQTVQKNL